MAEYGKMDPFSFAGSNELDHPVFIRMQVTTSKRIPVKRHSLTFIDSINLEGKEPQPNASTLLERPSLRQVGSNIE